MNTDVLGDGEWHRRLCEILFGRRSLWKRASHSRRAFVLAEIGPVSQPSPESVPHCFRWRSRANFLGVEAIQGRSTVLAITSGEKFIANGYVRELNAAIYSGDGIFSKGQTFAVMPTLS